MAEDPVQRRDGDETTRDGVVDWEPTSPVDRLLVWLLGLIRAAGPGLAVFLAFGFLLTQLLVAGGFVGVSVTTAFVLVASAPAVAIAGYVWYVDIDREPLLSLGLTFALGVVVAGLATWITLAVEPGLRSGLAGLGVDAGSIVGIAALFVLLVAPVEEVLKLAAVHLSGYPRGSFRSVIDGAVYGAVAGLGFATIENAVFIAQQLGPGLTFGGALAAGGRITTTRALVGPGHVLYSAFAGYYLGLARFNRRYALAIVTKGLLIAIALHAGYNVLVGQVPETIASLVGVSNLAAFVVFVVAYNGILAAWLVRKLSLYRAAYRDTRETHHESELTEFDGPVRD